MLIVECEMLNGPFNIQHSTLNIQQSLGLYIHLPFCRVHCTYCPFVISTDVSQQERYVEALLAEIETRSVAPPTSAALSVESIYFGGGTPSRTSVGNLKRIAARIRERFDVAPGAELSMEANPEDITAETLREWRELGVNRLSIGVQSFNDA